MVEKSIPLQVILALKVIRDRLKRRNKFCDDAYDSIDKETTIDPPSVGGREN